MLKVLISSLSQRDVSPRDKNSVSANLSSFRRQVGREEATLLYCCQVAEQAQKQPYESEKKRLIQRSTSASTRSMLDRAATMSEKSPPSLILGKACRLTKVGGRIFSR